MEYTKEQKINDLILTQSGWSTGLEHKLYSDAKNRLNTEARRIQLEEEVKNRQKQD